MKLPLAGKALLHFLELNAIMPDAKNNNSNNVDKNNELEDDFEEDLEDIDDNDEEEDLNSVDGR
ncbi:MAG: hypothetical protein ACJ71M_18350 [Nitrososphaeraceae archaeon]